MENNVKAIAKLLGDYDSFVSKRSIVLLVIFDEVFPKILEWHFSMWKKEYELLNDKDKLTEWSNYSEISRSLDSIFKKTEERSLKEGQSFSFFDEFKKHLDKYQNEYVGTDSKKFYYVKSIVPIFFQCLIDSVEEVSDKYDMWEHYFPGEWKITKENLEGQKNIVPRELLNHYLEWSSRRFWTSSEKEQYDKTLDGITSNLFPSTDPVLWAQMLTFLMRPWVNEKRMDSLITKGTNFGFVSRVYTAWVDSEPDFEKNWHKQMSSQEDETIDLALYLFPQQFNKNTLEKYIQELKGLSYLEKSDEEIRRKRYILIFERMLKKANNDGR